MGGFDDASLCVDVRLRDRTRFHAVLGPLSKPATSLSLRELERQALRMRPTDSS